MKQEIKTFGVAVLLAVLNLVCAADAQTIIMDSTHHNGNFTAGAVGFWYNTPNAVPSGWAQTSPYPYTTAVGFIQVGSTGEAVNNTGELVETGVSFTVSADLGGGEGTDATVRVYATQNADGTGNKVLLASVHRIGLANDGYNLFNVPGTAGSPAPASVDGYYVQVAIGGPYVDHYISGNYDNIVVTSTSTATPLPLNDIDFWANDRLHLPDYGASTNLILNPSFEAGFRYWGFLCYAQSIVPLQYSSFQAIDNTVAHSGSQSLRLRALSIRDPLGVGVFPLPLNASTNYTLSFWAKGSLASSLKLNVWARGRNTYFLPGGMVVFPVTDQWQRFTIPINQMERFVSIFFDAQISSTTQEGSVWLDDVQLELGTTATDFKQAPVSAQLVSSARGNFLEFGQEPNSITAGYGRNSQSFGGRFLF